MINEEKLLAYLNAQAAYSSSAVPKKNTFTYITKLTGIPQVWTLDQQQQPVQFAELPDRVLSVYHSPDGEKTVVGMDHHGDEKQQIYLIKDQGALVEPLVNEPHYFHHIGGWSPDGKYISFSSNRRHPGFFDLFIIDVDTKEITKILEYDGNLTPITWLPDGKHMIISIPETNIDEAIFILNIETKEMTRIGKEQPTARYQSIKVTKAGDVAYLATDLGENTLYLGKVYLNTPSVIEKIEHVETWDIEEVSLSPNENTLLYTLNEGGIYRLFSLDLLSNEKIEITGIAKGVIESISWLNDEEFVFTLKTPTSPGDIWQYSLKDQQLERKTIISRSDVEEYWLEPEICTFNSFDGLEVPYFLYDKEKGQNKPAVLWIHGGPESQTKAEYNPVIQFLVDQGFVVVAPNVRGSNGYGRKYIQLDDVRKRMDAVKDLKWLVQDLVVHHGVDPKKVGIMGRSYGGFMVLAALTHYPELWAAGVDIVGISHFKTFLENTGPWRRRLRAYEYGTLEDDAEFFEEIAPLNHSHKIKAPLLVFHGRNDTRVPVSEAEQLVREMRERGQTVEFIVFEDEGHQTEKIENHITMNSEIVKFMKKYL